jgi:hypothetical protein
MKAIKHQMQAWEIKYGQILFSRKDYESAANVFKNYLDKSFDIETFSGTFRNKHFLHYEEKRTLRLSCKPFFENLNEGDIIYIQPFKENIIKISKEGGVEPPTPLELPLIKRLREAQRNSENPSIFERALVDAFNTLGFSARHIGGRDEPDIFINDKFNIILDSKTTKEGTITERYINFDAMDRYKEKYQVRYIGVVAPGFSEGYIRETARGRGIILIETEAICRLLQNHVVYPYKPDRIVDILFKSGRSIITPDDIPPSTIEQKKLIEVVAKTIPILKHFEKANMTTFSANNLRIALLGQGLNYSVDEIEDALKFLSTSPFSIILQKQNDKYSPTDNIDSILKKIGLLIEAFNRMER